MIAGLLRLRRVQPDVRDFGTRVRAPRHDQSARPAPAEEEGVGNHDSRLGVGRVGERVGRAHVAHRIHALVGRPHPIIHFDPPLLDGYAGRFEPEPVDVGRSTHRHENVIALERHFLAVALGPQNARVAAALRRHDLHVGHILDPVTDHGPLDDLGGVRILARQDVIRLIEHGDPGAEAGERLSQFAANGPGPDHQQMCRPVGQRKDGLVRQIARLFEPGCRQGRRPRTGRDHGPAKVQAAPIHFDRVRTGEVSMAQKDVDPQLVPETSNAVVSAEVRSKPSHPGHRFAEIAGAADGRPAEFLVGHLRVMPTSGRADDRL